MRRGRILILLAMILLIGAVGGFFVIRSLGGGGGEEQTFQGTPAPEQVFTAQIVFAAQDIPRGSLITEDAVILSPFPANNVIETMVTDTGVVVGKYARMDIARGVPITLNMITDQPGTLLNVGSEASIAIPNGMTAISIPMPEATNGVAYAVQDGDKVDVLVSIPILDQDTDFQTVLPNLTSVLISSGAAEEGQRILTASANLDTAVRGRVETEPVTGQLLYVIPSEGQQARLVTQRLIENATVLHVGEFPLAAEQAAPAAAEGVGAEAAQGGAPTPAPPKPKIITLIVTPQEALSLHWAAESGINLTLTLRAPNDSTEITTTSVTLQYLLDTYSITVPTKLPFRVQPSVTPVMP
jgi:Flp pilus assembly protein CpaB